MPASACRRRGSIERTFDLDAENNVTGAPVPDGIIDPSGIHFINLTSALTSRDNLREGVADLVTFAHALPALNIPGGVNPAAHPLRRPLARQRSWAARTSRWCRMPW